MTHKYNKKWLGVLLGLIVALCGYGIVSLGFETLENMGIVEEASSGSMSKRQRTIFLMAICCNLLTIQFLNKRRQNQLLFGIGLITLVLAGIWIAYYGSSLFFIEQ